MEQNNILLEVNDLSVSFDTARGEVQAVSGISYHVHHGEVMGIVGESGSGKSAAAYAIMGLLKTPGKVTGGKIVFDGNELTCLSNRELASLRGSEMSMIFQDPMQGLDPVFTIGYQLTETVLAHEKIGRAEARERALELLRQVGIHEPEQMMKRYQHELSGGMRQRVMIAIALLCRPKLLIADEPTTALDVTIQDQIMQLLRRLRDETGMSVVFITHNFGLVADLCDRVTVMYGGMVMERGTVDEIFYDTAHPYTVGLMNAIPKADMLTDEPLIPIEGTPHNPLDIPQGCVFSPRCSKCMNICTRKRPQETRLSETHSASCWLLCKEVSDNE